MSLSPSTIAGTILFVAPARITTLSFGAISTVLALEAARRVLRVVTDFFGYSPNEGVGKKISDWTPDIIHKIQTAIDYPATKIDKKKDDKIDEKKGESKPTTDVNLKPEEKGEGVSDRQLLKAIAICAVITNIGWEFSKWLSGGEISPYYNVAARFVGPLVLDENYRHPAVQFGIDMVKKAVPSLA
jgi:hypothetical protein